jgi:hypothetical protein
MDWTSVSNAKGAMDRIRTIFYLCRFHYEADPRVAGERLATEADNNELCRRVISEIRAELTAPSTSLGPVVTVSDAGIWKYLEVLLRVYDQEKARK